MTSDAPFVSRFGGFNGGTGDEGAETDCGLGPGRHGHDVASDGSRDGVAPGCDGRLVRIPARHLERAIQRDYAASGLAGAISDIEGRIATQQTVIADNEAAIEGARDDGVVRELRHRLLIEKRGLLAALGERTELDRSRLQTKIRLMERLQKKHDRQARGSGAAEAKFEQDRKNALSRLEAASGKVTDALAERTYA